MKDILDKLIADAPEENEGSVEVQLLMRGTMYAGAIRLSEISPDIYEMLSVGQGKSKRETIMITIYINPEAIDAVMVPAHETYASMLSRPPSGLVIPGAS